MDAEPKLTRSETPSHPGLRISILLALAGVMLVAFVPLFFAIAQVTRGTALAYREDAARATGHAVAVHLVEAVGRSASGAELARIAGSHVGEGGALAVVVFNEAGEDVAHAGELASLTAPEPPFADTTRRAHARGSRMLDTIARAGAGGVLVRVRIVEDPSRTVDVVRAVGLYMALFALALLVFAYMALTRAIVRPIEQLARAAEKVARGGRVLEAPQGGAREITELGTTVREMAARLLAEEEALRDKVAELTTTTRRLSETREQLAGSEHMASVGRLAAGVAHEIGNPIAAIMGMHDLMDGGDLPTEDREDFLRRMRKETERINVVVRDLLDYARPEDAPASGVATPAVVSEVASDVLSLVRPQKEWRGIEATVEVPSELRVGLSAQRLTQVLLNLLLNAAAALGDKPSGEPRTIRVRARAEEEGTVRIEVEDDGPGVPAAMRERIFDPFVTTKEVGAGTGLGLSVCRGIVEGARGRIFVDPTYARGARFTIVLPRVG